MSGTESPSRFRPEEGESPSRASLGELAGPESPPGDVNRSVFKNASLASIQDTWMDMNKDMDKGKNPVVAEAEDCDAIVPQLSLSYMAEHNSKFVEAGNAVSEKHQAASPLENAETLTVPP